MIFLAATRSILSELVVFVTDAVMRAPDALTGDVTTDTTVSVLADATLFLVPVDTTENLYFLPDVKPVKFAWTVDAEVIVNVLVAPPLDDVAVTI
jgi:hypothetical protein